MYKVSEGSSGGSANDAGSFVSERFKDGMDFAKTTRQDALVAVQDIITAIEKIAGIDTNILLPIDRLALPNTPLYIALLQYGANGMPAGVETAIWQRGLERAQLLLADSIDRVTGQWSTRGFELPDGVLTSLVQAEIDKFEAEQYDLNRDATEKSFNVAAEFAKYIVGLANSWEIEMLKLSAGDNTNAVETRLKIATAVLTEQLEKNKLIMGGFESIASIFAQLAASALTGTSASASVSDGHSQSEGTSTSTSYSPDRKSNLTLTSRGSTVKNGETGDETTTSSTDETQESSG
jgi:hypothetical protein